MATPSPLELAWRQELPDYCGEYTMAVEAGQPGAIADAKSDFDQKVAHWLQKRAPPRRKIHRRKAFSTLVVFDHLLRVGAGVSGLNHFMRGGESPLEWPLLTVTVDQDSANLAALSFAVRKLGANLDIAFDLSHGGWNDVRRSVRDSGDWSYLLLFLASVSMVHGPYQQDMRLWQLKQGMREYGQMATSSCPWFQFCAPMIAKDRGEEHRLLDPEYMEELWQEIAIDCPVWSSKGTKPSLSRFFSVIRAAAKEQVVWNTKRHNQVVVCLLEGLLSHSRVEKYLAQRDRLRAAAAADSTKSNEEPGFKPMIAGSAEEKAIKAAAQNLLVVSTLFLDDDLNARMCKLLAHTYLIWNSWHSEQNKKLRQTSATLPWTIATISGGFDEAMSLMFGQCRNPQDGNIAWGPQFSKIGN